MSRSISKLIGFFFLFGVIALALHIIIGNGLARIKTSEMGAFNRAMTGNVNAEIVISGSSRAYAHYDPSIIGQMTGRRTFNLGRNGSHTDIQLAVLKAYLSHNVKPELLIQNLDMHSLVTTPRDEILNSWQYLPYLREPDIYNTLLHINSEVWKWKWIPLYGYVVEDVNFGWNLGFRGFFGRNPPEDHFEGYLPSDEKWTGDFDRFKSKHPSGVGFSAEQSGVDILVDLISLCKTNAVKVVLVFSPQYLEMLDLVTNRLEVFAKFREIAARTDTPFLDYTSADYCHDRKYFYNSQHLNRLGAETFSRELGRFLVDTQFNQTSPETRSR